MRLLIVSEISPYADHVEVGRRHRFLEKIAVFVQGEIHDETVEFEENHVIYSHFGDLSDDKVSTVQEMIPEEFRDTTKVMTFPDPDEE